MDKIVSINRFRRERSAQRGFREWKSLGRPGLCLDGSTTISDLGDDLILFISEDHPESRLLVYDLIMGVLDLGSGYEFEELPSDRLISLLDVYFMIMDLFRFECMKRIGWLDAVPCQEVSLVDLILKKAGGDGPVLLKIRSVGESHPAYAEFMENKDLERQTIVRRYAREAVQIFRDRTHLTCCS